ncbi:hypothetical protein Hte_001139 [Hypoxylon texense]
MDPNDHMEIVDSDVDSDVDQNARPARDDIAGVVLRDGKFRCGEALPNGNVCGSRVTNTKPAIARHMNNLHNPNSSYLRRQNSSEKRQCDQDGCGREFKNENSLRSHKRDYHGVGGKKRYALGSEAGRGATEPPAEGPNAGADLNADADNVYPAAKITIGGGVKININAGFNIHIKPDSSVFVHPGSVVNFHAGAVINVEEL